MTATVSLGALTDIGRVRRSNQDVVCVLVGCDVPQAIDALVVVADGMGGGPAGEVASALAVEGVVEGLKAALPGPGAATAEALEEILGRLLRDVNARVHEASLAPGRRGMGTTLTMAVLAGAVVVAGNVGDSRGYLLQEGRLRQLTRDHSWVEEQVSLGLLTREEAERDAKRNMLTRAVGTSPEVEADIYTATLAPGDGLLLCSDGLYRLVEEEEMERAMTTAEPQQACRSLVDLANSRGGLDNITVAIAQRA